MEARPLCPRCRRPPGVCWCAALEPVHTRTRVVFLQHPREAKVKIGTARMAHLGLPNSELHRGVCFEGQPRIQELLAAPGTALLFPGEGAVDPTSLPGGGPATLIVVDGTWPLAKKLLRQNPALLALPRIGLDRGRPSNYRIRREPAADCLATVEAVVEILAKLEGEPARFASLIAAFTRMVDLQLEATAARTEPQRARRKRHRERTTPSAGASLRARWADVLLVHGEANAHGRGAAAPGRPELLHLVALRPATGARFEALLAPRRPLAPRAPLHLDLTAEEILAGEPAATGLSRFAEAVTPTDLFVSWGSFSCDILATEGFPRDRLDLRRAGAELLKRKPGGPEEAVALLGLPPAAPWASGRAGKKLAALEALVARLREVP